MPHIRYEVTVTVTKTVTAESVEDAIDIVLDELNSPELDDSNCDVRPSPPQESETFTLSDGRTWHPETNDWR